jgi:hypothetical protein
MMPGATRAATTWTPRPEDRGQPAPLTDEQRDLLAMIFRSGHRRKLYPAAPTERPACLMVGGALVRV